MPGDRLRFEGKQPKVVLSAFTFKDVCARQLRAIGNQFRRLRQDAITTELMDIVGGYEALHGGVLRGA